jgi:hypothetical protein
MQALHEYPILPRALIEHKLSDLDPADPLARLFGDLDDSGLSEQLEQIKISLDALDRDEISKVWSSFQAKYRPSAYYQASVALIQSERELPATTPVGEGKVRVHVEPYRDTDELPLHHDFTEEDA